MADPAQALRMPLVPDGGEGERPSEEVADPGCGACSIVLGAIVLAVLLTGPLSSVLLEPLMLADGFLPEKLVVALVIVGVASGVGFLCYNNWRLAMIAILMLFTMACSIVLQATLWADPDNE